MQRVVTLATCSLRFLDSYSIGYIITRHIAGIAQLVERNLAKVEVASSNLVSRSIPLGLLAGLLSGQNAGLLQK